MHCLVLEYPLYCNVAPSRESIKLPMTPPNTAMSIQGNAGRVAPLTDVRNPDTQKVIPINRLPAMPHSVPNVLTPPLVPLGTVCSITVHIGLGHQCSRCLLRACWETIVKRCTQEDKSPPTVYSTDKHQVDASVWTQCYSVLSIGSIPAML